VALDTRLKLTLSSLLTGATDLQPRSAPLNYQVSKALTNGTGANQANAMFSDQREIAASGNDDLDLAGTLTDAFGATVTFARVKLLLIKAADTNQNNLVVGGASSTFTSWVTGTNAAVVVRPGGLLVLSAADATAYAVTATSADVLRLSNSGAGSSISYDIVVIGTSA
jgi:hypothetical protein